MLALFLISMEAGRRVFTPIERDLAQTAAQAPANSTEAQMANFKRMKLAFISFDLFNGYSRQDIEESPSYYALAFHGLIASLMAVGLLRHWKPRKSR